MSMPMLLLISAVVDAVLGLIVVVVIVVAFVENSAFTAIVPRL